MHNMFTHPGSHAFAIAFARGAHIFLHFSGNRNHDAVARFFHSPQYIAHLLEHVAHICRTSRQFGSVFIYHMTDGVSAVGREKLAFYRRHDLFRYNGIYYPAQKQRAGMVAEIDIRHRKKQFEYHRRKNLSKRRQNFWRRNKHTARQRDKAEQRDVGDVQRTERASQSQRQRRHHACALTDKPAHERQCRARNQKQNRVSRHFRSRNTHCRRNHNYIQAGFFGIQQAVFHIVVQQRLGDSVAYVCKNQVHTDGNYHIRRGIAFRDFHRNRRAYGKRGKTNHNRYAVRIKLFAKKKVGYGYYCRSR